MAVLSAGSMAEMSVFAMVVNSVDGMDGSRAERSGTCWAAELAANWAGSKAGRWALK